MSKKNLWKVINLFYNFMLLIDTEKKEKISIFEKNKYYTQSGFDVKLNIF